MKKIITLSILAIAATVARANSVVYDNGTPDLVNGWEMTQWAESEDIVNTGFTSYDTLRFWTLSGPVTQTDVALYYDSQTSAGAPGNLAIDLGELGVTSTDTGRNLYGYEEYENVVNLGTIFASGDFTYHLALYGTSASGYAFWETTADNGTNASYSSFANSDPWEANDPGAHAELAFRLEQSEPTPEPATMAVLGLGAMLLRRRSKK